MSERSRLSGLSSPSDHPNSLAHATGSSKSLSKFLALVSLLRVSCHLFCNAVHPPPTLLLPVSSIFQQHICYLLLFHKELFVFNHFFLIFLRRLRPFTRTVLFSSSLLPCVRSSSTITEKSSSLFWLSLHLLRHVAPSDFCDLSPL